MREEEPILKEIIKSTTISEEAIEVLKRDLPKKFSDNMTESIIKVIDAYKTDGGMSDDEAVSSILENLNYIKDIKGVTLERYCTALRFVSLVLNGVSQVDAWKSIFPEKNDGRYTQERMIRWAGRYANSKLVSTLKASMMVAFSIQYSHFRHAAIKKQYDLMMGKASPSKVPRYERDPETGRIVRDRDGQMIYLRDSNGEIVFEDVYQVVTPKVQQEASAKILDITAPAEDKSIDINIAISQEEREHKTALIDALKEIALKQREALERGASIEEVQQIGNIIEAKIVDTGDDDE